MFSLGNNGARILVALLLCATVALFVPAQAKGVAMSPEDCCAAMQAMSETDNDCPLRDDTPSSSEESECCQGGLGCLTMLFLPAPEIVYAPTGEISLVSHSLRGHSLPHPPPVPPPRFPVA